MNDDLLSQFRRTPHVTAGDAGLAPDAKEYHAFGTKDHVQRLQIRKPEITYAPGYNLLTNVVSDGTYGTHMILIFTMMTVLVRGRNLQAMVFAIEHDMAGFIEEFDGKRWAKPPDEKVPVIDSIEVNIDKGGSLPPDTKH